MRARALAALAVLVPLLGAGAPPSRPLLLATHDVQSGADFLLYVDGNQRIPANAGPGSGGYGLLETLPNGDALIAYTRSGFAEVEEIAPNLQTRPVKSFPLNAIGFVGPSSDGFVAYSQASQFLQRYDPQGKSLGGPIAALGATSALGLGAATIALSKSRLMAFDRNGRLRHAVAMQTGSIAALPGDRFAVADVGNSWVRIYDTGLEQLAYFSFPGRALLALVSGPDGSLGVMHGALSCVGPGAELDVFDDPLAGKLGARIYGIQGPRAALALTADTVYVANSGCLNGDGSIAVYNRDGTTRTTLKNVGTPSGILPFTNPTPPPSPH